MEAVGTACPGIITVRRSNAAPPEVLIEKKHHLPCYWQDQRSARPKRAASWNARLTKTAAMASTAAARPFFQIWEMPARAIGRCLRAPLITPDAITRDGTPLGADASALLAACFPDQQRYEIHGGDAFVVRGDRTEPPPC